MRISVILKSSITFLYSQWHHTMMCCKLYAMFLAYVEKNKGKCIAGMSPINVQLDKDNKTMVQPDVLILCDRDKIKDGRVFGASDLLVEVLSPSTKKKDAGIKLSKYTRAGVKEYWIVAPVQKRVIVHKLQHEGDVTVYGFEDKVPMRIFDNKCEVDFTKVYEHIRFLYEK